jgi:hypothetical protein
MAKENKKTNGIILYFFVTINWLMFTIVSKRDRRFQRAIAGFNAVFQFRSGNAVRQIVFKEGKISTKKGAHVNPDFELIFIDLPGMIKQHMENPGDMLMLLLANKIDKRGNTYFLFKFGYLAKLCEVYFRNLFSRTQHIALPQKA